MKRLLRERIVRYRGKDIEVAFHVDRCTHVAECLNGLPRVFNTFRKPWIEPDNADADKVAEVILKCPTGALHYKRLDAGQEEKPPAQNTIVVIPNGPFYIWADMEIYNPEGTMLLAETRIALCRCGASKHKPFCDGLHALIDFQDPAIFADIKEDAHSNEKGKLKIIVVPEGPYQVSGPVMIQDDRKRSQTGNHYVLCACGKSKKMPFCDGSHARKS